MDFGRGLPRSGQWRNGFDVADVDGDGRLDVVHGPPRKGVRQPHVFRGDGSGGWQLWGIPFPHSQYAYGDVAARDIDADGDVDLVLGMHMTGVAVLRSDGRGAFDLESLPAVEDGATFSSRAIEALDWNGDGLVDVVAYGEGPALGGGNRSEGLVLFRAKGSELWESERLSERGFGGALIGADVDGDGRPDLLTDSSKLGRTDVVHLQTAGDRISSEMLPVPARSYATAIAAAKAPGSSTMVAVAYESFDRGGWQGALETYERDPEGNWRARTILDPAPEVDLTALDSGDVDGDGAIDLVALGRDGTLMVFRGVDGTFRPTPVRAVPPPPAACRGYAVRVADLDGDGAGEIVAAFAGEAQPLQEPTCERGGGLYAWKAKL